MKRKTSIFIFILILLTTFTPKNKIIISKFNLKEIEIENNFLLHENDIKKMLYPIYDKNLLFLKNSEIKKLLMHNSFVDSFNIKKKYPNSLKVEIFEKKPIAILIDKKKKFYISEKIELIEFENISNYRNLPYIFGDLEKFKIFYNDLKKINFPFDKIKKYVLLETNRWDLETKDNKILKLPIENYIFSLENYLNLESNNSFQKYKTFDYRIYNQLILK